jgi:hypothetical protein
MSPRWRRVLGSDVPELVPDEPAEPVQPQTGTAGPDEQETSPPAARHKAPAKGKTGKAKA